MGYGSVAVRMLISFQSKIHVGYGSVAVRMLIVEFLPVQDTCGVR